MAMNQVAGIRRLTKRMDYNADKPLTDHDERRSDIRADVLLKGELRSANVPCRSVAISDLSAGGCQFKSPVRLEAKTFVTIRLGQVGPIDAKLRWQQDDRCGVAFERPLYAPVLEHIQASNPAPSTSADDTAEGQDR